MIENFAKKRGKEQKSDKKSINIVENWLKNQLEDEKLLKNIEKLVKIDLIINKKNGENH